MRLLRLALIVVLAVFAFPSFAVQPDEVMKDPALEARARALQRGIALPRLPEPVDRRFRGAARARHPHPHSRAASKRAKATTRCAPISSRATAISSCSSRRSSRRRFFVAEPAADALRRSRRRAPRAAPRAPRNAALKRRGGSAARGADRRRDDRRLTSEGWPRDRPRVKRGRDALCSSLAEQPAPPSSADLEWRRRIRGTSAPCV